MGIPIIGDLIDGIKDIVSEVIVDKDKRDQINLELRRLEDQAQARLDAQVAGQIEVNKVEAASGSLFVAGWRPAIGWVGAIALLWSFVLGPLVQWVANLAGSSVVIPDSNFEQLITIVLAMLGIGAQRTIEKIKGVSTNDYNDVPGRTQPASTEVTVTPTGSVTVNNEGATTIPRSDTYVPVGRVPLPDVAPKKKKKVFGIF